MLPKDPIMLLSYVNTKLRDYYSDLETMCEDMEFKEEELVEKLMAIDYHYDRGKNQFV